MTALESFRLFLKAVKADLTKRGPTQSQLYAEMEGWTYDICSACSKLEVSHPPIPDDPIKLEETAEYYRALLTVTTIEDERNEIQKRVRNKQ